MVRQSVARHSLFPHLTSLPHLGSRQTTEVSPALSNTKSTSLYVSSTDPLSMRIGIVRLESVGGASESSNCGTDPPQWKPVGGSLAGADAGFTAMAATIADCATAGAFFFFLAPALPASTTASGASSSTSSAFLFRPAIVASKTMQISCPAGSSVLDFRIVTALMALTQRDTVSSDAPNP